MPARRPNLADRLRQNSAIQLSEKRAKQQTGSNYAVTMVPIDRIVFDERNSIFNSNDTAEDIKLLAEGSLRAPDELRNPIHLNRITTPDGEKLVLIAGENRTKAFMYQREQALKANPLLKSTEWDVIPAYIHDNLNEDDSFMMLVFDNTDGRVLTLEQRYLALEAFIDMCEKRSGKVTTEDKDEIKRRIGVSRKHIERLMKIRKNADERDLQLLKDGKISFKEFKKRTEALIQSQKEAIEKRNQIISKQAIPRNYIDEETGNVLFIGQTADPLKNEIRYCTFLITPYLKAELHRPDLGEYASRSLAQVDLDRFASNNLMPEYKGDFSEFKMEQVESREEAESQNSEPADVIKSESDSANSESVSDVDNQINLLEELEDNIDNKDSTPDTISEGKSADGSDNSDINEADNSEADEITNSFADDSSKEVSEESDVPDTEPESEAPYSPSEPAEMSETAKSISGEISHFEGINLNGMLVQGSLLAAPNGRVYIVSNFKFGKNIGTGKFDMECTAEEVDRDSVRRIDDI